MLKQPPLDRVILAVPFALKDEAKQHGACWDAITGQWWKPRLDIVGRAAVYRWIPEDNPLRAKLMEAFRFQQGEGKSREKRKGNGRKHRSSRTKH